MISYNKRKQKGKIKLLTVHGDAAFHGISMTHED